MKNIYSKPKIEAFILCSSEDILESSLTIDPSDPFGEDKFAPIV